MLSFRQKILISYAGIFLVFTALLYPVASQIIQAIQEKNILVKTRRAVNEAAAKSPSLESFVEHLHQKEKLLFLRLNVYDPESEKWLEFRNEPVEGEDKLTPEVLEALKKKQGYDIRYSPFYEEQMAYLAIAYVFQGKTYIIRTVFPHSQIQALTDDFTIAFLILSITILLLFGVFAGLIIHHLTRPVQQIINAIKPFQLGHQEHIPEIKLDRNLGSKDEFGQLAETLNALSKRIEHQINTLIQERNDKAAILESLGEGVIAVDRVMTVTYINHMAEMFLGLKKEELLGKTFLLTKMPRCHELIHQAQEKKEPVSAVLKPEGKPKKYLDAIAVPRGEKGAIFVIQDKTSLHKVIELGRDFIANASHELKTPITIIRGFAETLYDHPELSPEVFREIIEKIVSNCQRMDTLVKNLLALAAVDEGLPRSRLQECDLVDLVSEARQTMLAVHPTAEINIFTQGDEPIHLMVDSDLFIQAILNLLDNAVKYSKPPAKVFVRLKKRPHEVVIQVSDQGIGIPHEHLERIFERFYAVDKSHSRSMGGSGLGLSIVERIVEKHQGKIEVESTHGVGTTFTMTFPIQEEDKY